MTKRATIGLTIAILLITANVVLLNRRNPQNAAPTSKPTSDPKEAARQPVAPASPTLDSR